MSEFENVEHDYSEAHELECGARADYDWRGITHVCWEEPGHDGCHECVCGIFWLP